MPLFEENFSKESLIEYPGILREDKFVDKGRGHNSDRKVNRLLLEAFQTPFFDIRCHLVSILVTRRMICYTETEWPPEN
jgi:hypothetical protein